MVGQWRLLFPVFGVIELFGKMRVSMCFFAVRFHVWVGGVGWFW